MRWEVSSGQNLFEVNFDLLVYAFGLICKVYHFYQPIYSPRLSLLSGCYARTYLQNSSFHRNRSHFKERRPSKGGNGKFLVFIFINNKFLPNNGKSSRYFQFIWLGFGRFNFLTYTRTWRDGCFGAGGVALTWYATWALLVSDEPAKDKFISASERAYLLEKVPPTTSVTKVSRYKPPLMSSSSLSRL